MIAYLDGKVVIFSAGMVILDVGGVGYRVMIPHSLTTRQNERMQLYTYHHVRENIQELYGFKKYEELILFEQLLSVNGVGPKASMSILSAYSAEDIRAAIDGGNTAFFSAVSGIGKKVAAKIVLELKGKHNIDGADNAVIYSESHEEVYEALTNLGYKRQEIAFLYGKMPADKKTVEDKIKWLLQNSVK